LLLQQCVHNYFVFSTVNVHR